MAEFKVEVDLAESVLKAYEYHMRDIVPLGHCQSIEWKYKPETQDVSQGNRFKSYPPEVYEMVKLVMGGLFRTNRNVFGTLMSKYSKVSPFYKRPSRSAITRNQSRRYTSREWAYELERSLWLFWQEMKKQPKFSKYFGSTC